MDGAQEMRTVRRALSGAPQFKTTDPFHESIVQAGDGCAQVGLGSVPELRDEGMPFECLLDDSALDPFAAAVDQPHLAEPGGMGLVHVLFDE